METLRHVEDPQGGTSFTSFTFAELESQNHIHHVIWTVLWRPAGPVRTQKRSARQGYPVEIWITPRVEFPQPLWTSVPVSDHPFSLCLISCVPTCPWCLSSFHCASLRRVCLLYIQSLNSCRLQYIPRPVFSLGSRNPDLSSCPHMPSAAAPGPPWVSCAGLAPVRQCLSCTGEPKTAQCSRCGLTSAKQVKDHPPGPAGCNSTSPGCSLPSRARCWLMLNLSTRTQRSFSAKLLPDQSFPIL